MADANGHFSRAQQQQRRQTATTAMSSSSSSSSSDRGAAAMAHVSATVAGCSTTSTTTTKVQMSAKSMHTAAATAEPLQQHSCEICGVSGLADDRMREHTRACHVEGSAQCPFCGLSGVAPAELLLHVNQAHLDYLTPENELMSFIDDQTPSVDDGDSDSMSECPTGYTPAVASNGDRTNGHASTSSTKLNGGAYTNHNSSPLAMPSQQNGHSPHPHIHNHHQHPHHQHHHQINGKQPTSNGAKVAGGGQQTKITNFYKKSMSADASSQCQPNGHHHQGTTRAMHCTLKGTHETRSCDNQDGRDYHHQHQHNQQHQQQQQQQQAQSTTSAGGSVNNGGGEGSPLRSQLGLNLKSHAPAATATKPSPLQCPMCPYTSDTSNVLEEHINRSHFDPVSPSLNAIIAQRSAANDANPTAADSNGGDAHHQHLNASSRPSSEHQHQQQHQPANSTLTALACPICGRAFEAASSLELHVNIEHRDILSPAANKREDSSTSAGATAGNDQHALRAGSHNGAAATSPSCCPVCSIPLDRMSTQQMEVHIMAHFPRSPQANAQLANDPNQTTTTTSASAIATTTSVGTSGDSTTTDGSVAGNSRGSSTASASSLLPSSSSTHLNAAADLEKQAQKLREQREFEMLRAQYGMDDQGNFREQSAAGMQRAVYAGEMSVADYYERQVGLRAAESHGIDDGTSCTRSVAPRVASLSATSPNVMRSLVCSAVDHYASSYGDKGWGCGYRNLQMLLSSLLQNTTYNEALYSAWGNQGPSRTAMPSISRLQKMVEAAWAQGFDVQGSEQLGCKLHNTRKWIGATEVVTVLSWLRINCQLIDFHRPTSTDGRHPDLFGWVQRYFEDPAVHTPPLYLQHQGHSRTIIGIEQRANGPQLLILDPSHGPRQVAALGTSQDSLRLIRRGSSAMRAPQYQIVAIRGLIATEDDYQASKVLRSLRIPPDC